MQRNYHGLFYIRLLYIYSTVQLYKHLLVAVRQKAMRQATADLSVKVS